jgi:hypothetical protein
MSQVVLLHRAERKHDRGETKLVYMLTSIWETSQISL